MRLRLKNQTLPIILILVAALTIGVTLSAAALAADVTYAEAFPDPAFLKTVLDLPELGGNRTGASILSEADIAILATRNTVDVSQMNIADLAGIEYFSGLEYLYCFSNKLTALDLSQNTKLRVLIFWDNQLSALDVSKNTALTFLDCGANQLKNLDVTKNSALENLRCYGNELSVLDLSYNVALSGLWCESNQLTALNVAQNTALDDLRCTDNKLTSLDVSKNTALSVLDCGNNQLSALNITSNTALTSLYCHGNQLENLDVSQKAKLTVLNCPYNKLSALNVSGSTALTNLWCQNNQLTTLDVSQNTALEVLACEFNQLTALNVSNNTALEGLWCQANQLTALDISKNTALTGLGCGSNLIETLDVSNNPALEYFSCVGNLLTALDVTKNNALLNFNCSYNQITGLDLSHNPAMTVLSCVSNQLTSLVLPQNSALTEIWGSINKLTALDVSVAPGLTSLDCAHNNLTALDVSKNTVLTGLGCSFNLLTALDVTKNTEFTVLDCYDNRITALDISHNPLLTRFYCGYNDVAVLDVSKNTALTIMSCGNNRIETLDVTKNTALTELYCGYNLLTTLDVTKNTALEFLLCYANYMASPDDVKGWRDLGLTINTSIDPYTGTFQYYSQLTPGQITYYRAFPDANFRQIVLDLLGGGRIGDSIITNNDFNYLGARTELDVSGKNIADLRGIEYFSGLTRLWCFDNLLASLDVSGNYALTELYCYNNYMTYPDSVSGWRELNLVINSPQNLQSGTFRFYNQLELDRVIEITTQPQDLTIAQGNTYESLWIGATVTPSGFPAYSWYRRLGADPDPDTDTPVGTGAYFFNLASLTEGIYYFYCVVSAPGANSVISRAAMVTVQEPELPADPSFKIAQADGGNGSSKLVLTTTASATIGNLTTLNIAMSYDNAVIVPVNATTGVEIEDIVNGSTSQKLAPFKNHESFIQTTSIVITDNGNLTTFDITINTPPADNGVDCQSGAVLLEFYFKIKSGKTEADMNSATFNLTTTAVHPNFSVLIGNKAGTSYRYGTLDNIDTLTLTSFTYTNSNVGSGAPGLSGPTTMTLTEGYAATSTDAYTITGTAPVTVTLSSGNAAITWNDAEKRLDIAAGLTAGDYPVVLTASNGILPNATLTFTLSVNAPQTPPGLSGPTTMTLTEGYTATSTGAYTITGTAPVTVTLSSGNAAITWNDTEKRLDIAAGLTAGDYPVVLTASNGILPNATLTFILTVNTQQIPPNLSGPTTMTLTEGYAATSTGAYTITGSAPVTVTLSSGNAAITWNDAEKRLDIAAGLTAGDYPVVLTASNGILPNATLTFTLTVNSAGGPTYTEAFPDVNFRAEVLALLNVDGGGRTGVSLVSAADKATLAARSELRIYEKQIADLTGIEYFGGLQKLYCSANQLTALDVSQNTALTELVCQENKLTALDVTKNTALTYLECWNNPITSLDVTQNTALTNLYCGRFDEGIERMAALDVTKNTELRILECWGDFTTLDVSQNTKLTRLHCGGNRLTSLDVSNNTALVELYCGSNLLTALDVSKNTALMELYCGDNQLSGLDISKNTALELLSCGDNVLMSLNVTGAANLAYLWCANNQLASISTQDIPKLIQLYCQNNLLTELDVSKHTELDWLFCYGNKLKELDVSQNTKIRRLFCYNNQLADLDISKNTALTWLQCQGNLLTDLDVTNNAALTDLYCYENNMTSPDDVKGWQALGLIINSPENPESGNFRFYNQKQLSDIHIEGQPAAETTVTEGAIAGELRVVLLPPVDPFMFQWYSNTAAINSGGDPIEGATSSVFAIPADLKAAGSPYYYYCVISAPGFANTASAVAKVNVLAAGGLTFAEAFPDPAFLQAVLDLPEWQGNRKGEDVISEADMEIIAKRVVLEVNSKNIQDLSGIEYFAGATWISAVNNKLTEVDLTQNTALERLFISGNLLEELDVSKNTALTTLSCYDNMLTALDMSTNPVLATLHCWNNKLMLVDVSKNTNIYELYCSNNLLTSLQLSLNTALMGLECANNQLTALDVSQNTLLTFLDCSFNKLSVLDVSKNIALVRFYCNDNRLTGLDVTNNTALASVVGSFWCYNNYMAAPDNVKGWQQLGLVINSPDNLEGGNFHYYNQLTPPSFTYAEAFPDANFCAEVLAMLNADGGARTAASPVTDPDKAFLAACSELRIYEKQIADLTGIEYFSGLLKLYCSNNQLTALDVSQNTALTELSCQTNKLTALDVSANTALTYLECWNNPITSLNVTQNTALTHLYCGRFDEGTERLAALDVTKNTDLIVLECWGDLTVLDVTKNTKLTRLHCGGNQLTELDLANNAALEELICTGNQLTSLDVSKNTALKVLYCISNKLTALDVSKNTALTELYCGDNQLTGIDVSKNSALVLLSCGDNKLTSLNITGADELAYLWCANNQLASIATPDVPKLIQLYCQNNLLTALDMTKHTELDWFFCYGNQLTELNVSQNTKVRRLFCYNNLLAELDVSSNTALTWLQCQDNLLTVLDVTKNAALTDLYCFNNYLASPDDVKGWQALGLTINSPANLESGTFRYYNQLAAPTPIITITAQPVGGEATIQDGVITSGGTLTIAATVSDGGAPSYQWYQRLGALVDPATDTKVGEGANFTIPVNLSSGVYYYYCVVSAQGAQSVISETAALNVAVIIVDKFLLIVSEPDDKNLTEGSIDAVLSIEALGYGGVLTYQWYAAAFATDYSGAPIAGATYSTFAIPADLKAAGSPYYYYCVVSEKDAVDAYSRVATVNVKEPAPPQEGITVNFPSITGATVQYYTNVSGWVTVGTFNDSCNFVIPDNHRATWGATTVQILKGGMWYTFSNLNVGKDPLVLDVPLISLLVLGLDSDCNIGIIQEDWAYRSAPATAGAPNYYTVFDNGKDYKVQLYKPGFYPITVTAVKNDTYYASHGASVWANLSSHFYQVEVPAGVSNVWVSSYDWAVRGANAGEKITLLKDPTNIRTAKISCVYGGRTYNLDFKLDGSDPFDLIK